MGGTRKLKLRREGQDLDQFNKFVTESSERACIPAPVRLTYHAEPPIHLLNLSSRLILTHDNYQDNIIYYCKCYFYLLLRLFSVVVRDVCHVYFAMPRN